jgi:hypothetical protein
VKRKAPKGTALPIPIADDLDQFVGTPGRLGTQGAKLVVNACRKIAKGRRLSASEEARAFVEYSRPKSSPTHHLFGRLWDDAAAAEQARLQHARRLIVSVRVVLHEEPTKPPVQWKPIVVRGGVRERPEIREAMADQDAMAQIVDRALADALAWARRHARLVEVAALQPIFDAVEKAAAGVRRRR